MGIRPDLVETSPSSTVLVAEVVSLNASAKGEWVDSNCC